MPSGFQCNCCGAPATVCLVQEVDGVTVRISLCRECAQRRGIIDEEGTPIAAALQREIPPLLEELAKKILPPLVCDRCGMTIINFLGNLTLGCERCYETFASFIEPLLRQIQKNPKYRGKKPCLSTERHPFPRSKEGKSVPLPSTYELEGLLRAAIVEEKYEEAASIRDQLTKIRRRKVLPSQQRTGRNFKENHLTADGDYSV